MNSSGFLLLNKPKGITTFKLLYPVKRFFKKGCKVGHAGTLDPDAHGLVIAAVGKATRLLSFIEAAHKVYEFRLHLGVETDSADATGEVTQTFDNAAVTGSAIEGVLSRFIGEITQTPPVYSAIKIDGKRACDRVRKGEEVTIKSREVTILDLQLIDDDRDALKTEFLFRCHCSKGTYIRSLGVDLGKALGSGAHVSDIKRLAIGESLLDNAVDPESETLDQSLISAEKIISHIPTITLNEKWIRILKNGIKPELNRLELEGIKLGKREKYFILDENGQLQMYAETDQELLRPKVQLTHE
ncbi:MAG: tRNA pseudouridine(55) synthase TruB [Fibrobacterales bacterium]